MAYSTIVAGTTIAASWANASVRDQVVTPFATAAARDSAITSPVEGMVTYITGDDIVQVYNGSAWVTITPQAAVVATSENTASTSYTDLSTSGPAVTVETGTKALVTVSAFMQNTTDAAVGYMSYAVSGDTTIAASDTYSVEGQVAGSNGWQKMSYTSYLTTLTAGDNTFTAKYKVNAGTGAFAHRVIVVTAVP